jgi:SAM-dependent methyltransferase
MFNQSPPPDWQLPPGVSSELWAYFQDRELVRSYDQKLAETPLLRTDQAFVAQHCPKPGRIVDLGCGTGRLLVAMARKGFQVVGVDLSEEMLRVAGEKAAAGGVPVDLVKANLVQLDGLADATFDHAACLFSTLGMIDGAAHRRQSIRHIFRLLRPGGVFVLHVHNRWFNFWDRGGRRWLLGDLAASVSGREGGNRVPPGRAGPTLHHFTRREATQLLRDAGFDVLEVRPVSLRADGQLRCPWWFGWLRSYGYLIAARRLAEPIPSAPSG